MVIRDPRPTAGRAADAERLSRDEFKEAYTSTLVIAARTSASGGHLTIAANLSVSLDGYFAGPDASPQQMLGAGGEVLQSWFAHDVADRDQLCAVNVLRPEVERAGAMVMGRDSYEVAESAGGPHPPFETPIFVLTHRAREDDAREGSTFTFVTDGFDAAIKRARVAAGEKDVMLYGGTAIQQRLRAEVLDELQLHVVPVLLTRGRRLLDNIGDQPIDLKPIRTLEGVGVAHLTYRIQRSTATPASVAASRPLDA